MAREFVPPRGIVPGHDARAGDAPAGGSFRNGHLPKALVADDEPDMLRFLKSQLIQHYEVIEAVDGQQAIEKSRAIFCRTLSCWT